MSGSTVGGLVGGTIGFFFGNPQLGWMIGSAIGGYVDPDQIEGPRLKDAQVQTSQEGVPRPIVYGTAAVAGNLIHRGPLVETRKKERAGKGGPEQITYHYHMTYAIRVCEGPIAGIRRIWRDDKLVYSLREGDQIDADSASFASKLTIYLGDETQLPDPSLEALPAEYNGGVGNVPSHRGTAYVVFENDELTERRGTIPQYRFEVVSAGTATAGQSGTLWIATNGSGKFGISYGGTDWASEPTYTVSGVSAHSMRYGGGTLAISRNTSTVAGSTTNYSDDRGLTWPLATLDAAGSGQVSIVHGEYINGRFWWASGFTTSLIRSDDGRSYTTALSGVSAQTSVSGFGSLIVAGANGPAVYVSTNGGDTFTEISLASSGYTDVIGTNGTSRIMICWRDGTAQYTDDGATFSTRVATTGMTGPVSCKGVGATWVAVGGGISVSVNGGDSWAAPTLPVSVQIRDVDYHNGLWVAVGREDGTSSQRPAVVLTATDPAGAWTLRANNFGAEHITSVRALYCDGTELPDAPGFYVTSDGELCGYSVGSISPDAITLASIVTDLCGRVGLAASQLDVSELTDVVTGFVVARQMPASEAIRALQRAYRFDFPEWDKKLRGIKRGGAIKATITDTDLVSDPEETRAQSVEFPRKLNLITADPEANYESVTETSARSTDHVKAVGETTMELPVIFSGATERAQVADILHKIAWTEAQGRIDIELPEEWTWLTPSDCFAYNDKRWRAEKTELLDGTIKVEAKRDRASAYTSGASGSARSPTAPASSIKGPTVFQAMNLPSLRTQDNQAGVYLAATGLLPGWAGADILLSVDGGVTERLVASITSRATMGELAADITASSEPITVKLYDGRELDSITLAQRDAGLNAFAITTAAVAEVGQFQTATDAGNWELTDTLRGQLGTTAAGHVTGDPFVLLDESVMFLPVDASYAGQTLIFRAVSRGTAPENNPTFSLVYEPPTFIIDGGGA